MGETNEELVAFVAGRAERYLDGRRRSPRVLAALLAVDRASFLSAPDRRHAYMDEPIGIGQGQTCSQPSMVAFMLDLLDPQSGDSMLEIGAGTGWAAALAARLCAPGGHIWAMEILPELAAFGRTNCTVAGASVDFLVGDGSAGLPEHAPFNRILVSAAAQRGFKEYPLVSQLVEGGVLVYPDWKGQLNRVTKRGDGLGRESWGTVAFVPLVGGNS